MKKAIVAGLLSVCLSYAALAGGPGGSGGRVICSLAMPTDQTPVTTSQEITVTGCASNKLQSDGGLAAETLWYNLSDGGTATGDGGYLLPDGGPAGCVECNWGPTQYLTLQCDNAVYVSMVWDGGTNVWNQKGVVPAATTDFKLDFDDVTDPRLLVLPGQSRHISMVSVTTDANTCKVGVP